MKSEKHEKETFIRNPVSKFSEFLSLFVDFLPIQLQCQNSSQYYVNFSLTFRK